jgi:hypothetical protein
VVSSPAERLRHAHAHVGAEELQHLARRRLAVAVQVEEFEMEAQTLKPAFHFKGSRDETRRFRALWVNWIQRLQPRLALFGRL